MKRKGKIGSDSTMVMLLEGQAGGYSRLIPQSNSPLLYPILWQGAKLRLLKSLEYFKVGRGFFAMLCLGT